MLHLLRHASFRFTQLMQRSRMMESEESDSGEKFLSSSGTHPLFAIIVVNNTAFPKHFNTQVCFSQQKAKTPRMGEFHEFNIAYKEHSCCLEDPFMIKYDYPADGKEEKTMDGYIISDTLAAMMRRELKVYYQPKFDATTNRMKSAEALVRWIRDDGSVILPEQFLPSMEQTGAITMLDWYIVEEVCVFLECLKNQTFPES